MSPRSAAVAAPQPARVVLRCRRCHREMGADRQVYCSIQCIELDDDRAARVAGQLASLQRVHDEEAAAIEAEISRFATEKRRILRGHRDHLTAMGAELAPLKSALSDAKAAGEIRFALASDSPAETGWR